MRKFGAAVLIWVVAAMGWVWGAVVVWHTLIRRR